AALDWLYGEGMRRPIAADGYREARRRFFGTPSEPAPAPAQPSSSKDVLEEFRARIAPGVFSAHHPGSFSYFTPPPLPMSIAGEVLAQWVNQGVDVWAAGPVGAFVEEEVTARLLGGSRPPRGSALERARVYTSDQAHFSIERGLSVLGFPPESLRIVASDERFRLHGEPVERAIAEDRAAGLLPFAICAVAG